MISKPVALVQVPNQVLFSLRAAARFLGISDDTLAMDADLGLIPCYEFHGRRTFKLADLERIVDTLPEWQPGQVRENLNPNRLNGIVGGAPVPHHHRKGEDHER